MVDYLTSDKSKLPTMKSPSQHDINVAIEQKKCKTCINYTFYFCNKFKIQCGPEGCCDHPKAYHPRADLVSA